MATSTIRQAAAGDTVAFARIVAAYHGDMTRPREGRRDHLPGLAPGAAGGGAMSVRSIARRSGAMVLVGILVAACGAASTPTLVPTAAPTPVPVAAAPPPATPAPTATLAPPTDGEGAEHIVGTAAANLQKPYTETKVGDITQVRDGVAVLTVAMNDPRATGMATRDFAIDVHGPYGPDGLGPEWGPFRLETADGAWEGPCSGGTWHEGDRLVMSCWLVGSGDYDGSTFYLALEKAVGASSAAVEGIIYPGPPPAP